MPGKPVVPMASALLAFLAPAAADSPDHYLIQYIQAGTIGVSTGWGLILSSDGVVVHVDVDPDDASASIVITNLSGANAITSSITRLPCDEPVSAPTEGTIETWLD